MDKNLDPMKDLIELLSKAFAFGLIGAILLLLAVGTGIIAPPTTHPYL